MRKNVLHTSIGSDLFWKFVCCELMIWQGYNDEWWWAKVSISDQFLNRTCLKCGKTWFLDLLNDTIRELK